MHRDPPVLALGQDLRSCTGLPNAGQERLLRVLLAGPEEAREAWCSLEPRFDLDRLDPAAFQVMPLLHARLHALGIGSGLQPRLAGLRRHTWYRGELAARRSCALLCALRDADLPAVLIDGPVLAARLYPEAGLRTPGEPVVLLRERHLSRALQVLSHAGWRAQHRTARLRAVVRSQRLVDQDGFTVQLGTERSGLLGDLPRPDLLWDSAEQVVLHEHDHTVPALDQLLLLLLQRRHREAPDRQCIWPVDTTRLLDHREFAPSWSRGSLPSQVREALDYVDTLGRGRHAVGGVSGRLP